MRKKILGFVFAAALLAAVAVPLFGGGTPAYAANVGSVTTGNGACQNLANGGTVGTTNPHTGLLVGLHTAHANSAVIAGTNC